MNAFMKNLRYEYDVIVGLLESEKDNYPEHVDKYIFKELSDDIINDYDKAYEILEAFVNKYCRVKCRNESENRYKNLIVYFTKPSLLIPLLTTTLTDDLELDLIQCCPDGKFKIIDNFFAQEVINNIWYPFNYVLGRGVDIYTNLTLGNIYDMERHPEYVTWVPLLVTYSNNTKSKCTYYICTLDDIDETFDMLCQKAHINNSSNISIDTYTFEYNRHDDKFEKRIRVDKYCKKF